jgi:hypothetical protein
LIEATRQDDRIIVPTTGELLKRFKVQHLGFELLRHGKQWVLREIRWRLAEIATSHRNLAPGSLSMGQELYSMIVGFWPDPTKAEFVVPGEHTHQNAHFSTHLLFRPPSDP